MTQFATAADVTWKLTWAEYPDVAVHCRLGIRRGYRLEGEFWTETQALWLLEEAGYDGEAARAYLDALEPEIWGPEEVDRWQHKEN